MIKEKGSFRSKKDLFESLVRNDTIFSKKGHQYLNSALNQVLKMHIQASLLEDLMKDIVRAHNDEPIEGHDVEERPETSSRRNKGKGRMTRKRIPLLGWNAAAGSGCLAREMRQLIR